MIRRTFVGAALAGLGGLFFPQKVKASFDVSSCLSSEELWMEILSGKQCGVRMFLHKPIPSKEGLSTTHHYDFLKSYCVDDKRGGKISFLFKNHIQEHGTGWMHPTSNMKYIAVCPEGVVYEDEWLYYEHHGNDYWSQIEAKAIMPWMKGT